MCGIEEAYRNLADAVVLKAVDDYMSVLKECRSELNSIGEVKPATRHKRLELEAFFDSQWCMALCGIDGRTIRTRLRRRVLAGNSRR